MRSTFHKSAVAGIAALALVLTACGSDDDTAAADATTESMASEAMTEDMTEAMTEDMTEDMTEMASEGETMAMEPIGDACSQIPADGDGSSAGMADDPVATAASNNPLLSTLVTAVGEADLVDTLNSAEGLTVFAPIDPAFEALPEGALDGLLADPEALSGVLTLHVAEGQMDAAALTEAGTVTTLNGADIEFDGEALTVTSPDGTTANVVCANVATANATVHLIDAVLLPAG